MPIRLACACGKQLQAPDATAGKTVFCPGCRAVLAVPAATAPAAPPAPPPPPATAKIPAPPPPPEPAEKKPAKAAKPALSLDEEAEEAPKKAAEKKSRPDDEDDAPKTHAEKKSKREDPDDEPDEPAPRKGSRKKSRRDEDDADEDRPRRQGERKKKRPLWVTLLALGCGGVLMLTCAGGALVGGFVYYLGSQQDKVVGKWVVDPDAPSNATLPLLNRDMRIEFTKPDKRCSMHTLGVEFVGKWSVVRNRENDAILVLVDFEEARGPDGKPLGGSKGKFQSAFEITPVDADHIDLVDAKDRGVRMRMKKVAEFDKAPGKVAAAKGDDPPAPRVDIPKKEPETKVAIAPKPNKEKQPDAKSSMREPKEIASFKAPNENRYLDVARFSPDGKLLVTTSSYGHARDLKVVDVPSGKERKTKAGDGFAGSFAFAPDGRLFVAFAGEKEEHQVRAWDLGKNQLVNAFKLPTKVTALALSPDGKLLACVHQDDRGGQLDRQLAVFDVATGKVKASLESTAGASAFSPNGRLLAYTSGEGNDVVVYDVEAGKEKHVLKGHKSEVRSLTFVDNRVLVTNTGFVVFTWDKEDKTVRVWDVETGKQTALVECPQEVDNVAVFPDGKTIVTTHKDKTARFWSLETGKNTGEMTPMERERVWHLAFLPDGKSMITTHYEQGLILWEIPSRKKALALKPIDVYCLKPVFTRDGKLMALPYTDGTVKLYELR